MDNQKPVNLDLLKFRFPIMAIVSILHRVSGVVLFLFLPVLLYALHYSLASESHFLKLIDFIDHPTGWSLMMIALAAAFYHLVAGVRHLLMDFGYFEGKRSGRVTAWLMIFVFVILTIGAGVWLW